MSRPAQLLRRCLLPLCGVVVLLLAGCGDSDRVAYATEADEPYYREGQALLKSGRKQEALSAFLKVIERRVDSPESHLEVGLLYQQHINDPLSAIYHFKKYLVLRPNSPQSTLVKQRIDACVREFARTLPAQPLDSQAQRVDLIATLDQLKLENDQLKQQIADLKSGKGDTEIATVRTNNIPAQPAASTSKPSPLTVTAPTAPLQFNLNSESIPTVRTTPTRTVSTPAAPPPKPTTSRTTAPATASRTTTPQTPAPAKAVRKHTVVKGDTLMSIALKYYGNRSKWRDIYAANRNVMKSESDIHVGMELVVP
ncbi:MAG TPA: LysM peptidoglycan-binding domain-containing protein [Candidatus Didemnitutus sp.]|nr:LysM peptidoglycan-binding domain-containing protein [Candidatus Didemnitutus sp.]